MTADAPDATGRVVLTRFEATGVLGTVIAARDVVTTTEMMSVALELDEVAMMCTARLFPDLPAGEG